MADNRTFEVGSIGWIDLTVPDAPAIRDFYQSVTGWGVKNVDMKHEGTAYHDYAMLTESGVAVSGVCHAVGANAALPAQWLIYIIVKNLAASLEKVTAMGGKVLSGPRSMGPSKYAIIQDPAGASCALFQADEDEPES